MTKLKSNNFFKKQYTRKTLTKEECNSLFRRGGTKIFSEIIHPVDEGLYYFDKYIDNLLNDDDSLIHKRK